MDGFLAMLEFIERNGLVHHVQPVQYALKLLIPPGSPLIETVRAEGLLGDLNEEQLSYEWASRDARTVALRHEVAAIVEDAADAEHHDQVFAAVKRAAVRAATGVDGAVTVMAQPRSFVPGLTEAWFC